MAAPSPITPPAGGRGTTTRWIPPGNGTPGIFFNGAGYANGEVGSAFNFSTSSQYVDVPSNPVLNPPSAITLEAWINPSQVPEGFVAPIIKKEGPGGTAGYAMEYDSTGSSAVRFGLYTTSGVKLSPDAPVSVANTWSLMTGVYDGTNVSMYMNGVSAGSQPASGTIIRASVPGSDGKAGRGIHRRAFAGHRHRTARLRHESTLDHRDDNGGLRLPADCFTLTSANPIARIPGEPITAQTTSDIVDKILALPSKTRVMLLAPVVSDQKGEFRDVIERLAREGFVRARVDGALVELTSNGRVKLGAKQRHTIEAVVDRLVIDEKVRVRLSDSVETALKWGEGRLLLLQQPGDAPGDKWEESMHSNRNYSASTGKSFDTLTSKHFSFNSPMGACPVCHGLGQKLVFDEHLIAPDEEKSLERGAVLPWRRGGKRMIVYYKSLLKGIAAHCRAKHGGAVEGFAGGFQTKTAARDRRGRGGVHVLGARGK